MALGRPTCGVGRPQGGTPGAPFGQVLPQRSKTLKIWCTAKSLLEKCPNYFSQWILKLIKYFWYFCEKGKVLEKFEHAENTFENFQICSGEKQMRCKENLKRGKSKYEINTNLPLARVCRLKSDVHDFSPLFLPFVGLSWRTG